MKIQLTRISNENQYLWGRIIYSDIFVSDSLEMGNFNQIQPDEYSIKLCFTKDHSQKLIAIFDDNNQFLTVLVKNNNYMYQNIEMRYENNFITIGEKATEAHLKNQEAKYFTLYNYICLAIERDEEIKFVVINEILPTKKG